MDDVFVRKRYNSRNTTTETRSSRRSLRFLKIFRFILHRKSFKHFRRIRTQRAIIIPKLCVIFAESAGWPFDYCAPLNRDDTKVTFHFEGPHVGQFSLNLFSSVIRNPHFVTVQKCTGKSDKVNCNEIIHPFVNLPSISSNTYWRCAEEFNGLFNRLLLH